VKSLQVGLGVVVGVAFIALLIRSIDLRQVASILGRAAVEPLLFGLAAFVADFFLRGVRFWAMLLVATSKKLSLRACIGPFIASFGISDILPLRAGDGFRILWFSRGFDIPMGTVVGAMAVERALDLLVVLLFAATSLALTGIAATPAMVSGFRFMVMLTIVGVVLLFVLIAISRALARRSPGSRPGRISAIFDVLANGLRATSAAAVQTLWGWNFLVFVGLSLICWILEYLVFFAAWLSLGGAVSAVAQPFLAFAFSTLGTLLPGLPGHFGTFEYFGLEAFVLTGIDPSFAAAVLFLAHLLLWLPTALFGIGWVVARSLQSYRGVGEEPRLPEG